MAKAQAAPVATDSTGSDGAAITTPNIGDGSNLPQLQDASKNEAELEAHISEVLGLPTQPVNPEKTDDSTTNRTTTDPGTGADDSANAGANNAGEAPAGNAAEVTPTVPDSVKPATTQSPEPTSPPQAPPAVSTEPLELKITDKNGTEFTLKPGDDIDVALKDYEPTSTGQALKILGQFQELNIKAEAQAQQAETAKQTAAAQAEFKAVQASWDQEITKLQAENRIGKPAVAVTDPAYAQDPVAQRVDKVFQYMTTENQARQAAAKAAGTAYLPIRSFADALDKLELQEMKQAQAKAKTTELEVAKQKSAAIGGGAGSGNGQVTPPYRPGQARSIWDV